MRFADSLQALFPEPRCPDQNGTAQNGLGLLLFDLDGTLINSVPDLAAAVDAMLQQFGREPAGEERVSHWVGNGADQLIRRALADGDEAAANAFPASNIQPWRDAFDQAYLAALHQATGVYPGVEAFLKGISLPKVLITNKPRLFTLPLLESLGWSQYFSLVLCGDDLAEKKPSPLPLLHACHEMKVSTDNALMIGDSRHDIGAAKAARIKTVAVSYGYNHGESIALSQPDLLVDNLLQLVASA
ncbi:phosphoglycolate phosphatase [Bacterioplanoides sp.]|uniref:phosphoglycolate phosphatase n=1 Tax=Bacterioplanoides sp. TaxID=2066072 RepID=UPI003AFFE67C